MNANQLHNLIYFCANFHRAFDCKIEDQNSEYILEKWEKYIGVKPSVNNDLPSASNIMSNKHLYSHELVTWIKRWNRHGQYDKMKDILNFILIINTKMFSKKDDLSWTPSELISTFEKNIGNSKDISNFEYSHLHELIMRKLHNDWLTSDKIYRDYKLCLLID